MLDHLIKKAREHFGITTVAEWARIRPEWILEVKGCGPETLNHIRLYLLPHGITLADDATVEFWAKTLGEARLGAQLSETDTLRIMPFTILVDSQEQQPFTFQAMSVRGQLVIAPYRVQSLGASHGDYSISGCEDECHIERKSVSDAISTFLAAPDGDRANRWLATIQFLASIPAGSVSIEGSWGAVLGGIEARGTRSKETLRRTIFNQVHAWQQDYLVPFNFYDSRRLAEKGTFYQLRRYWMRKAELVGTRETADVEDVGAGL